MRVTADRDALAFIREHGGMVFIRPYRTVFCGPSVDIEATTEPPRGALGYEREVVAEDFLLFFHPSIRRRPEELVVAVRGRRRPRVRVYWDGCTVGY
jgi:hypothetical protein